MKRLPLYRHLRESLKKLYPVEPTGNSARHLNTLVGFVYGIIQSHRVNLPAIAEELPNVGKEQSRIAQLKRWLSNDNIGVDIYFLPFISLLLQSLASQTLLLVIDGSTAGRGCVALMVSVVYKGRALPLLWAVRKGKKGHFPESMHVELICAVQQLIPAGSDVVMLGDGEFDGTEWLATLTGFGWKYVCRTAANSVFLVLSLSEHTSRASGFASVMCVRRAGTVWASRESSLLNGNLGRLPPWRGGVRSIRNRSTWCPISPRRGKSAIGTGNVFALKRFFLC